MKRFDFKLQTLLNLRQKKEDQQKIVLAKVSGEYQKELNKKLKVMDNIKKIRKQIPSKVDKVSQGQLKSFDQYVRQSDLFLSHLEIEIEIKRKLMQVELDIYTNLKKDRRSVEILREKALNKYHQDSLHEEQVELDEIGKNQYLKNQGKSIPSENY